MTETSTHPASLHAYFGYRDATAAIEWLERVLGFATTMQFPDEHGHVQHAELRRGDAAIMVFQDESDYDRPAVKGESVGHGTYVRVDTGADVDAVHARAVAAGTTVLWEPAGTEWGNYRTRVLDLEGFEWTIGTHRPGEPQGDWSEG